MAVCNEFTRGVRGCIPRNFCMEMVFNLFLVRSESVLTVLAAWCPYLTTHGLVLRLFLSLGIVECSSSYRRAAELDAFMYGRVCTLCDLYS